MNCLADCIPEPHVGLRLRPGGVGGAGTFCAAGVEEPYSSDPAPAIDQEALEFFESKSLRLHPRRLHHVRRFKRVVAGSKPEGGSEQKWNSILSIWKGVVIVQHWR